MTHSVDEVDVFPSTIFLQVTVCCCEVEVASCPADHLNSCCSTSVAHFNFVHCCQEIQHVAAAVAVMGVPATPVLSRDKETTFSAGPGCSRLQVCPFCVYCVFMSRLLAVLHKMLVYLNEPRLRVISWKLVCWTLLIYKYITSTQSEGRRVVKNP